MFFQRRNKVRRVHRHFVSLLIAVAIKPPLRGPQPESLRLCRRMFNIKPVTDLKNYDDVLRDIAVGEPVFLTENGRGRYVLIEMREYERQHAEFKLLSELMKADQSVKERGWLSQEDVEKELGLK